MTSTSGGRATRSPLIRGVPLPRLRELRHRQALTQDELATRAGVQQKTVHLLEARGQTAKVGTIRKLAAALGVELADLTAPGPGRPHISSRDACGPGGRPD